MILANTVLIGLQSVMAAHTPNTDTYRHTEAYTMAKTCEALHAVARKN